LEKGGITFNPVPVFDVMRCYRTIFGKPKEKIQVLAENHLQNIGAMHPAIDPLKCHETSPRV
jgi:hypothetical protein